MEKRTTKLGPQGGVKMIGYSFKHIMGVSMKGI